MHSQRLVYVVPERRSDTSKASGFCVAKVLSEKDIDKGLIKVDSYQLYGNLWDENSTCRTYQDVADYHNDNYAKETFQRDVIIKY